LISNNHTNTSYLCGLQYHIAFVLF